MALFPTGTFTTPNRVVLIGNGRYDEAVVTTGKTIYPGMLVMDDGSGNGTYQPHNVAGGLAELAFAIEQGLQGIGGATTPKGAFDSYDATTAMQYYLAQKGDILNVLLATGNNAAEGSVLISNGDGNLAVMAANANLNGNLYETTAASTALTASSTETAFSNGDYTIPANFLQVGDILHVRVQGIATAHNASDTLTVRLYLGGLTGTAIVSTGAVNYSANDEFLIDAYIELRTIGNAAAGTFIANGSQVLGTPGTATVKNFLLGSTAVDTTVAEHITVSGQFSSTNAGNSCRLDMMTVDIIRQSGGIKPLAIVQSALNNTAGTGSTYPYSPAALVTARIL